jgi:hypothetical protein
MLFVPSGYLNPSTDFHNIWCAWRLIPEGNNAVIFNRRLSNSADRLLKYQRSYLITGEEPLNGKGKDKVTGKVHSRTGHEAPKVGQRYICVLSLTSALVGVGSQRHASSALPTGMNRYTFCKKLSGPQDLSGRVRKNSPPLGFDTRTVQPVASCYTDWVIRPTNCSNTFMKFDMWRFGGPAEGYLYCSVAQLKAICTVRWPSWRLSVLAFGSKNYCTSILTYSEFKHPVRTAQ